MPRGTYIAVIGPGHGASPAQCAAAAQIGQDLAAAGAVLVCGGLGGVMEAACCGAIAGGGLTVGLLPGSDRSAANAFLSVALPTGLGELRNGLVVRAADAVIAVGGSWGTLSEIALAVRAGTPVVLLGGWPAGPPLAVPGQPLAGPEAPSGLAVRPPHRAATAAEAVTLALSLAGQ